MNLCVLSGKGDSTSGRGCTSGVQGAKAQSGQEKLHEDREGGREAEKERKKKDCGLLVWAGIRSLKQELRTQLNNTTFMRPGLR